jgi:hypothetical protein
MINGLTLLLLVLYGVGCYLAYQKGYDKGWGDGTKNCLDLIGKMYSVASTGQESSDDDDDDDSMGNLSL